jgi:hypothetical protein
MVVGDFDESASTADNADDLALSIPGVGVVVSRNQAQPVQLFPRSALRMAAGDLYGTGRDNLFVDFGPGTGPFTGIWIVDLNIVVPSAEPFVSTSSRHLMAADLDGNGRTELVVDFGEPYGIWLALNPATWIPVHDLSSEGFANGDLD